MTTEELKAIQDRAHWVGTTSPAGERWNFEARTVVAHDVPALCAEVERLQVKLCEIKTLASAAKGAHFGHRAAIERIVEITTS